MKYEIIGGLGAGLQSSDLFYFGRGGGVGGGARSRVGRSGVSDGGLYPTYRFIMLDRGKNVGTGC